ncbi:hypothetical protein MPSEU_001038500 [Mayamaea pseudoterrestris]|nr:hypothetical protein MPSEU_001038500 [Mayamaea pseudoterrestris]
MKYGEHLKANIAPEYGPDVYLQYETLDQTISQLAKVKPSSAIENNRVVSMTAPPQTNAQGLDTSHVDVTEEHFLRLLESEMIKVETFTLEKVTELRNKISETELKINDAKRFQPAQVLVAADEIANDFLRLEMYVNINFMGFHKILKKHDKNLPNLACKAFYVNRLHAQAWVRGDYSDIVVRLSNIYATCREDHVAQEADQATQSFSRSTSKYWVKTEDVSRVKYAVLRHLPVFLQKTSTGESDSQFTNSVYVDNDQLELYHGRLEKLPGAIALRLRWYGPGDPDVVFVERKTHNDSWTGEVSVKERFMIKESEVHQVLTNTYPIAQKKKEMLAKGKSQKEADEWETLVREITQVCVSKQLVPTMRTQCMRTAFQIPFDATVRVSLDTNLCMISERGYDLQDMKVWHRDPEWVLEKNEIHRFPHAVLEIKLELKGDTMVPPKWVTDLQNSGLLYECHKYSKYVHGCAVLLPEDVQAVPYWVDDVSLRQSIIDSEGQRILADESVGVGAGANEVYSHLLPFGSTVNDRSLIAVGRTAADRASASGLVGERAPLLHDNQNGAKFYDDEDDFLGDEEEEDGVCSSWCFPFCSSHNETLLAPTGVQKIEPKVFFANERTFLHWLHHAVVLSTIAAGVLAFSDESGSTWGEWYALCLLPISLAFCIYALNTFLWRSERIKNRIPTRWDDVFGPMVLGWCLCVVLAVNFLTKLVEIAKQDAPGIL